MASDLERSRARITDPRVMRALAHPARLAIMEHLGTTGAGVTATQMAGVVDLSPSATSYHLRELKKYGLVEQAEGRGDGRERVWRSRSAGWQVDDESDRPEALAAQRELVDVYLKREFARLREFFVEGRDEWADESFLGGMTLLLTRAEMGEVQAAVQALLEPYQARRRQTDPPEGARPVTVHVAIHPAGEGLPAEM